MEKVVDVVVVGAGPVGLLTAIELTLGLAVASIGPSIVTLYRTPMRLHGAVSVAISQSGTTTDT